MKKFSTTLVSILVMAAALFTVIHFIWSDLYLAEFDTDNAGTAIWGQMTLDTGRLIDPDYFYYGMLIPVGGNLFFAPFVKAFGMGVTALRAGYTVLAVLFAALLVLALRACLSSWNLAMIGSGLIMIFTTATERLRDIIWAHSVYYGVSAFFLLMCIGSLGMYLRGKRGLGGVLFFLSVLLCSINGNAILLFTVLPLGAAILLDSMNRERPSEDFMKGPLLLICIAIALGVGINKGITSGIQTPYTDEYTRISQASEWVEHLRLLPERWFRLFFDLPEASVPVMSSVGIKLVLRLGTAIVLSVIPFFSFSMLRESKSRLTRVFVLYHWILCAVMMFFFIFGVISGGPHRLIPLWFSCMFVDWLTMMWMEKEKGYTQIAGAVSVCAMVLFAGMTAVSVPRQPADISFWYGTDTIYRTLQDHGLTHGYSTDFQYTNSITVLSNGEIASRFIVFADDGFEIPPKLVKSEWYGSTASEEKTFLICWEQQFFENPWLADDAVEVLRATQYTPIYRNTSGYCILVYDRDVIAEKIKGIQSIDGIDEQVSEN